MSQDKIDIKDVTPKTYNPKTHKGNGDRFNPSNRIYVRESKGTYQKLRRYGGARPKARFSGGTIFRIATAWSWLVLE